jgi:outer membrane protein
LHRLSAPTPKARWVCLCFGLAALLGGPARLSAQPLPDLANSALAIDPAVRGAQAQVRAAEQRVLQARAAFGPTVAASLTKSETRYHEEPTFDLRPFASKQANVQVTQPLLRGTLFPSLDAALAQLEQAQAQFDQARAESMQRLVEACFDVLKGRDALTLLLAQRAATLEQLASAQRSFKIGTAPVIDVREAEARADAVMAQLAAAEQDFDLKQQVLAEIVGRAVPDLQRRGLDGRRLPVLEGSAVLEWLATALAQSPQLRQAQLALTAAEADVRRAGLGHAPTADLTYTYTVSSETGSATSPFRRRADSSALGLSVNVPLFASGATQAKEREAIALRDKAQSDIDAARRNVTLAVRQGFSATLSALAQARGLETAVRSAEVALRANRRGYEVGMKVNADVLDAQSRLFEVQRDLSRARYDAWFNHVKLKAVAGQLSEIDLAQLDSLLAQVEPATPVPGPRR